ncbi:MAG: EamA family transporter [Candidatus Micrarchaeota archaeon]|nr:EamA family transporter [Candidatus Micrarchaeota archaeon]
MRKEHAMVAGAGILSGFVVFGAGVLSSMGLSLYEIGLLHGIFILFFIPIILIKKELRPDSDSIKFFAVYGFLAFLSNFTEFAPVIMGIPVAIVTLLLYTQPFWTVAIGKLALKEKITRGKTAAALLVVAGAALIAWQPLPDGINPLGVALALAGGLVISLWVVFGRIAGKRKYHPLSTQTGYYSFMLIFLALSYPAMSLFVTDKSIVSFSFMHPAHVWVSLFLYFIFAIMLSHILYYQGAKKVPASTSGIILLLEPIVASVLAYAFLGQHLTAFTVAGGAFIILGNYIVLKKENLSEIPDAL